MFKRSDKDAHSIATLSCINSYEIHAIIPFLFNPIYISLTRAFLAAQQFLRNSCYNSFFFNLIIISLTLTFLVEKLCNVLIFEDYFCLLQMLQNYNFMRVRKDGVIESRGRTLYEESFIFPAAFLCQSMPTAILTRHLNNGDHTR